MMHGPLNVKSLNFLAVHTTLQLNVWRLLLPGLALRLWYIWRVTISEGLRRPQYCNGV